MQLVEGPLLDSDAKKGRILLFWAPLTAKPLLLLNILDVLLAQLQIFVHLFLFLSS